MWCENLHVWKLHFKHPWRFKLISVTEQKHISANLWQNLIYFFFLGGGGGERKGGSGFFIVVINSVDVWYISAFII